MRIVALRLVAFAAGTPLALSILPAKAQSPNEIAQCRSIADPQRRAACLNSLAQMGRVAQPLPPSLDRALDCRNPQDAALCREIQRDQAARGIPALSAFPAPQPSFSCPNASTPVERLICADPELTQWDRSLGETFQRKYALLADNERRAFLEDQRRWIATRNSQCDPSYSTSAKPCVLQLTKARFATLAAVGTATAYRVPAVPLATPPENRELDCRNPQDASRCAELDTRGRSVGPSNRQVAPQYPAPSSPARQDLAERLDGAGLHADAPGPATPIQQSERAVQQTDPYADNYAAANVAHYVQERKAFLDSVRVLYFAAGCKVFHPPGYASYTEAQMKDAQLKDAKLILWPRYELLSRE
jgi:uncharacterized protein